MFGLVPEYLQRRLAELFFVCYRKNLRLVHWCKATQIQFFYISPQLIKSVQLDKQPPGFTVIDKPVFLLLRQLLKHNTMKTIKLLITPFLLSIVLILASATRDASKETERVHKTINVLKDFSQMKESIPHDLISEYQGIVIIPDLINAGFVAGGKRGRGIAMVKLENGSWSDPVFVTLTGGSVGLQIGVQSVDLVLVFRHKGVLTKVKNGDFTIGGDASATAGPVGRSTSANTDYKLEAEVYS
jgi:lipid-binding SYLF domain-containing protein